MAKISDSSTTKSPEAATPKDEAAPPQPVPYPNDARRGERRGASVAAHGARARPVRTTSRHGQVISERKGQFLIAPRRYGGLGAINPQVLQFSELERTLRSYADVEVIETVGPKTSGAARADAPGELPRALVAKMSEQKAGALHLQAQGSLIIERDRHLKWLDPALHLPPLVSGTAPAAGSAFKAAFVVVDKDDAPLRDAELYLFGSTAAASGVTDEHGRVTLSLNGERDDSIQALYVKPKADYWSFYQARPAINPNEPNVVGLRQLADWPALADFPKVQTFGWGQKAMRLDQVPASYRGQGVKIAIVDSGVSSAHEDLKKIRFGFDAINKKANQEAWGEDSVAHGSHCAGVIAGADNALGVRGFAPDAEVHVCKLFPGGRISQLIEALEYCIEAQIDIVNLSLGGIEPSEILEMQLLRAKQAGVACIAAAGNSGGPVQYPASSPNVLAVAAIGKLDEFPPDSYHAQALTQFVDASGYFAARFSCYGPEIAVCGPGVAIASSILNNNYAVWDGTSMAASHVSGLAALVLAHHPEFQTAFRTKGPERVERLFQIIRASARRLNLGDPGRTGYGLPDAPLAVGMQAQAAAPMMQGLGVGPQVLMSGQLMGGTGLDPAYVAFMQMQMQSRYPPSQVAAGAPGYPFALPAAVFGRTIW